METDNVTYAISVCLKLIMFSSGFHNIKLENFVPYKSMFV